MATVDFNDFLQRHLKDPEFKAEFDKLTPIYQLKSKLIAQRLAKKMTQSEVAKISGLKQSNIARLENSNGNFSLDFAIRYARAVGLKKLEIKL